MTKTLVLMRFDAEDSSCVLPPNCSHSPCVKTFCVKLVPSNLNILPSNYEQYIAFPVHRAFILCLTFLLGILYKKKEERMV